MFFLKKLIIILLSYLILAGNMITTSHLTPDNDIVLGRNIYNDRCKVCHGEQGDGKTFSANVLMPPPKNFTAKNTKEKLTRSRMIHAITHGQPNTAMMAWEKVLNEQEIYSVVSYIRKELMKLND